MRRLFLLCLLDVTSVMTVKAATTLESDLSIETFAAHWAVESEADDYRLQFMHDTLEVTAPKGLTLWRKEKMQGKTVIEYDACLMDEGRPTDRPSDLNCFWMAQDPTAPQHDVFYHFADRHGVFKNCYTLCLYYLGYGGNLNSTTRFRRYHGEPQPEILQEYTDASHLNVAGQWRHIRLEADGNHIRYLIDGECLVDYHDPSPLTEGWFGVRTTWSRLRVTHFTCHTERPTEDLSSGIALHWAEGTPMSDSLHVRFGLPFARGTVRPTDAFVLANRPVEMRPLAYWPDRSVKWAGFAATVAPKEQYLLQRASKKATHTDAPTLQVQQTSTSYVVTNGSSQLYLPRLGGARALVDSMRYQGQTACLRLRPVVDDRDAIVERVDVEYQTAQELVFKVKGTAGDLDFVCRLYIAAGTPTVRLVHTIIYNKTAEQTPPQSLRIATEVPLSAAVYNRHVAFTTDNGKLWHEPVQPVTGRRSLSLNGKGRGPEELYLQQNLGGELPPLSAFNSYNQGLLQHWATWDRYRLSQLLDEGFSIRKAAKPDVPWIGTMAGRRSTGGGFVGETGHGLAFALHDFWQSYPSTLTIEGTTSTRATVSLYLWSAEAEPMDLRHYDTVAHDLDASYEDVQEGMSTPQGIARTSTLTFCPTTGYLGEKHTEALLATLTSPHTLVASPTYLHDQHAFGIWSLPDTLSYPDIEHTLTQWVDFYLQEIDHRHWYGFWDYGDIMHAYDNIRGNWRYDVGGYAWDNTELASNMMLWYNFLRTGRADIWKAAVAMTRHTSEVDVYHQGEWNGLGSRHNVSHWGCGSKEARISQTIWNRFYYYLSGGDERIGELMEAQRDLDTLLYRLDPMRLAQPRGKYPCTAPARLRIGPDWLAYVSNWMTAYERTLDTRYWKKITAGMNSISHLPQGIFSGPKALGYDPATGVLSWEGEAEVTNTNHLLPLMGGFEMMNELLLYPEVPDSWRATWLTHCQEYHTRARTKKAGGYAIGRLPAYAYHLTGNNASREEALHELDRGAQTQWEFSTNGVSTWSLDAIYMLEVCPPLPKGVWKDNEE